MRERYNIATAMLDLVADANRALGLAKRAMP
jgi:hypothetical protein